METSSAIEPAAGSPPGALAAVDAAPDRAETGTGLGRRSPIDPAACPTCGTPGTGDGAAVPRFVYAVGRIQPRFPNLSIEKEYAQAASRVDTAGLTDRQMFHKVLSIRENRYLARQLCWIFSVAGLETYLLTPRDPFGIDLLIGSLRAEPTPSDMDIIVGLKGPLAPPTACNGLMVPIVWFDQIYSFDRASLIRSIPRPNAVAAERFAATAQDVLDRILQIADNSGASDEHRAVNYLVVRYPAIYAAAAEAFGRDESLTAIEVRPSSLAGTRRIVEVVFSFTNRNTDVTGKSFVRVDVTEEFPFLVTKLAPTFDR